MDSLKVKRVPELPNEVVHTIFEALWDTISIHPGRDYGAIPPSPGYYYANALLVSKTWYQLALPFFVRWWSKGEPDRILQFVKEKEVGHLVRHVTVRAWSDVAHVAVPLRETMWQDLFSNFTHLGSISVRVDRLDTTLPGRPSLTSRWIEVVLNTLRSLPLEQRQRIRKLNLQFANDVVVIEDWIIHGFAETLPSVSSLLLQGFGPPTETGELSIVKTGRVPEEGGAWWTGLKHLSFLHFQTQCDTGEVSVATQILTASSSSLLTLTIEEFVQQLPFAPASPLSDVLGSSIFPVLQRLFVSGPALIRGQENIFLQTPSLTHLNIPIASRTIPHAAPAAGPTLLTFLPHQLTHLTLTLDTMTDWIEPLSLWLVQRTSLRYLSIDKEDTPDDPLGLMGLVPVVIETHPLSIEDLTAISDICDRKGILFASADERLWGGNEDLWELDADDEMASEGSGVASSGVEEVEDFDAEDDVFWASKWSAEKRRDMAIVHFCESMKLDLKAGVEQDEIRRAVEPFLRSLDNE